MSNQSHAYRFGSAIGLVARAMLHAKNPAVRWVKRAVVAGILMWLFVANFSWIVSSLLTIGCFGLMIVALVKGDGAVLRASGVFDRSPQDNSDATSPDGYQYGPEGYGYYVGGFKSHS